MIDPELSDDKANIQQVFSLVDRELWMVTAAAGPRRGGLLATWVSAASLDPHRPTVMVGIAPNHFTCQLVDASGGFALHLLRPDQVGLALQLAIGSGRDRDKLSGLRYAQGPSGSPLLQDVLAWLDCRVFARLEAGDRIYFWADILAGQQLGQETPLRERRLLAGADSAQREALRKGLLDDLQVQRPEHQRWRGQLPRWLWPNPRRDQGV